MSEYTVRKYGDPISPANTGNSTLDTLIERLEGEGLSIRKVQEEEIYFVLLSDDDSSRYIELRPEDGSSDRVRVTFSAGCNLSVADVPTSLVEHMRLGPAPLDAWLAETE